MAPMATTTTLASPCKGLLQGLGCGLLYHVFLGAGLVPRPVRLKEARTLILHIMFTYYYYFIITYYFPFRILNIIMHEYVYYHYAVIITYYYKVINRQFQLSQLSFNFPSILLGYTSLKYFIPIPKQKFFLHRNGVSSLKFAWLVQCQRFASYC